MNLEDHVISTVHEAIGEAIKAKISGYNSPLDPLIAQAVTRHSAKIESMLDDALDSVLAEGQSIEALKHAAQNKIAKALLSKLEGEIDKRVNDLRSNPEFRAKLTLAVTNVIKEIGK